MLGRKTERTSDTLGDGMPPPVHQSLPTETNCRSLLVSRQGRSTHSNLHLGGGRLVIPLVSGVTVELSRDTLLVSVSDVGLVWV